MFFGSVRKEVGIQARDIPRWSGDDPEHLNYNLDHLVKALLGKIILPNCRESHNSVSLRLLMRPFARLIGG